MRRLPLWLCALLLPGCGGGRVAQCNEFVAVYNRTAPEIAKAGAELASPTATPESVYVTLGHLGDLEGSLATETQALAPKDVELRAHLDAFVASARRIQESMSAAVKAGKAGDPNAAIVALANYSRYAGDQDQKIAEIRAYCAGEPSPPPPPTFEKPVEFPAPATPAPGTEGAAAPVGLPSDAAFVPTAVTPAKPGTVPMDPGADLPQDD